MPYILIFWYYRELDQHSLALSTFFVEYPVLLYFSPRVLKDENQISGGKKTVSSWIAILNSDIILRFVWSNAPSLHVRCARFRQKSALAQMRRRFFEPCFGKEYFIVQGLGLRRIRLDVCCLRTVYYHYCELERYDFGFQSPQATVFRPRFFESWGGMSIQRKAVPTGEHHRQAWLNQCRRGDNGWLEATELTTWDPLRKLFQDYLSIIKTASSAKKVKKNSAILSIIPAVLHWAYDGKVLQS